MFIYFTSKSSPTGFSSSLAGFVRWLPQLRQVFETVVEGLAQFPGLLERLFAQSAVANRLDEGLVRVAPLLEPRFDLARRSFRCLRGSDRLADSPLPDGEALIDCRYVAVL